MSGRRTITAAMERRIIMAQLWEGHISQTLGYSLLCGCGCGTALDVDTPVIHEHIIPLALGGPDVWWNIRLYRKECAALKTNGPRHVKVDGDASKIAKAKRLRGETGTRRKKPIPQRVDHVWPKRAFQKQE